MVKSPLYVFLTWYLILPQICLFATSPLSAWQKYFTKSNLDTKTQTHYAHTFGNNNNHQIHCSMRVWRWTVQRTKMEDSSHENVGLRLFVFNYSIALDNDDTLHPSMFSQYPYTSLYSCSHCCSQITPLLCGIQVAYPHTENNVCRYRKLTVCNLYQALYISCNIAFFFI